MTLSVLISTKTSKSPGKSGPDLNPITTVIVIFETKLIVVVVVLLSFS